MSARQKLNFIHASRALFLAAILGGVCQSWIVFLIAAAALIAGAIYVGDLRLDRHQRP